MGKCGDVEMGDERMNEMEKLWVMGEGRWRMGLDSSACVEGLRSVTLTELAGCGLRAKMTRQHATFRGSNQIEDSDVCPRQLLYGAWIVTWENHAAGERQDGVLFKLDFASQIDGCWRGSKTLTRWTSEPVQRSLPVAWQRQVVLAPLVYNVSWDRC
jgi:hypothetical protein